MQNVDRIIRARDYSLRHGGDGSVRSFIRKWRDTLYAQKGIPVDIKNLEGEPRGEPVRAFIHQGQWLAACEACGGHEFADPDEPVFFCWGCTNRLNSGYLRPVLFPENWQAIEQAVLARPVNDLKGASDLERAGLAQAQVYIKNGGDVYPLVRSWKPEESLEELLEQNKALAQIEADALKPGETVVVDITPASNGEAVEVSDGI